MFPDGKRFARCQSQWRGRGGVGGCVREFSLILFGARGQPRDPHIGGALVAGTVLASCGRPPIGGFTLNRFPGPNGPRKIPKTGVVFFQKQGSRFSKNNAPVFEKTGVLFLAKLGTSFSRNAVRVFAEI